MFAMGAANSPAGSVGLAILEMQFAALAGDLDGNNIAFDFKATNADGSARSVHRCLFAFSEGLAVDHCEPVVLDAGNSVTHQRSASDRRCLLGRGFDSEQPIRGGKKWVVPVLWFCRDAKIGFGNRFFLRSGFVLAGRGFGSCRGRGVRRKGCRDGERENGVEERIFHGLLVVAGVIPLTRETMSSLKANFSFSSADWTEA